MQKYSRFETDGEQSWKIYHVEFFHVNISNVTRSVMLSKVAARSVFAAILDREFNSHVFMVQSYWIGDFKSRMRGHFLELSSVQPFPGNFAVFQTV